MSNRLYLSGVSGSASSGTNVAIDEYPSGMDFPTHLQAKYFPSLDGSINIQRRVKDDRLIKIMFSNVKEKEEVLSGLVGAGANTVSIPTNLTGYADGSFATYWVTIGGETVKISNSTLLNGVLSLSTGLNAAPSSGTAFTIYRKAAWVDSLLANRYVLTDYEFDLGMEPGYTFSILPDGITQQRVIIMDVVKKLVPASQEQNIYNVTLLLRKVST